ncbi:hypothetical protein BGW38_003282, partial [Lunasporangiospora selenospora]
EQAIAPVTIENPKKASYESRLRQLSQSTEDYVWSNLRVDALLGRLYNLMTYMTLK